MRYGSFWSRVNAYGYDIILVQVFAGLVMWQFAYFPTMEEWVRMEPAADTWVKQFTNLCLAFSAIYNIAFVASDWQATPGKRACKLQVVNRDGSRLTLVQSALRHAASGISTLIGGIGFLFALFTRERTALHDMLCNTRVIRKEPT